MEQDVQPIPGQKMDNCECNNLKPKLFYNTFVYTLEKLKASSAWKYITTKITAIMCS